jgi:hypothetical protein
VSPPRLVERERVATCRCACARRPRRDATRLRLSGRPRRVSRGQPSGSSARRQRRTPPGSAEGFPAPPPVDRQVDAVVVERAQEGRPEALGRAEEHTQGPAAYARSKSARCLPARDSATTMLSSSPDGAALHRAGWRRPSSPSGCAHRRDPTERPRRVQRHPRLQFGDGSREPRLEGERRGRTRGVEGRDEVIREPGASTPPRSRPRST